MTLLIIDTLKDTVWPLVALILGFSAIAAVWSIRARRASNDELRLHNERLKQEQAHGLAMRAQPPTVFQGKLHGHGNARYVTPHDPSGDPLDELAAIVGHGVVSGRVSARDPATANPPRSDDAWERDIKALLSQARALADNDTKHPLWPLIREAQNALDGNASMTPLPRIIRQLRTAMEGNTPPHFRGDHGDRSNPDGTPSSPV